MRVRGAFPLLLLVVLIPAVSYVPIAHAGPYRNYDTVMSAFISLATSHPELVTYETVGKTVENRDIIMFKIGNPDGSRVLFDGAMHAWECVGTELLYVYARWLLTSNDPLANHILVTSYTLLVPALNVDGYDGDWVRKNANGVDLNRNFATNWERAGSSNPNSDYYHGPAPLSEPESQTMVRLFQTYRPGFYVSLHVGGTYYAGSYFGNRTYYSLLVEKINSLSRERKVTQYYYHGEFGGGGMAISDAALAGVTSFLMELTDQIVPFSEIETVILPRFIPVAAVLSQEGASSATFPPWDVDQNGVVDIIDLVAVACALESYPRHPKWNPRADINMDGAVDISDLVVIGKHFGQEYV